MQDALRQLTEFWTEHGCMVTQPFNTEVGAGTMNPATVLRVLGPEPWRVAYPEPSVRPDDARYGENPNRLQTFTQYQVILKPEPANPQELYLKSLVALGVDLQAHDVRFVEDNWQQPAIGAWGLGWEVWLDGTEITQFTYFQQVGGVNLDPVSCEITYGLERILMAVQGVQHFKDIAYAPGITYGEAFGQNEYEMSRYYLDDASIETNRALYDAYVAEAQRMIDERLPVPAHQYVLKSSHAFNVLDARGAISTTERAGAFNTMRSAMRQVAKLWVERREEQGFPLGRADAEAVREGSAPTAPAPVVSEVQVADGSPESPCEAEPVGELGSASQAVAFEIGVEELPPHVVPSAVESVRAALVAGLGETRLEHGEVTVHGTPRRIVAMIDSVAASEPDATKLAKGPKWQAAYDDDGNPTRPLQGFMKGQGVTAEQIVKAEVGGNEHACVEKPDPGRSVMEVLSTLLADVVAGLRAEKNMRWCDPELTYSRAVRWLVALWGEHVVPVQVSQLRAGRVTYVHRIDAEPHRTVATAENLPSIHAEARLVVNEAERRAQVVRLAQEQATAAGGSVDVEAEAGLIDEITHLVEQPVPVRGSFDAKYLDLPEGILTTVMRKHQRYLPVRGADGALLPVFITMANGECDHDAVAEGNASVLRARYEDALFFWNADRKVPLGQFREALSKLTFENTLGSMALRADRIRDVAAALAERLTLSADDAATLQRAGELAKFDLATQMVVELSKLAGYMAREYAVAAGEPQAVADALYGMEQPRTAADDLPATGPGAIMALADRLDLLMAMFAIGAKPSGSSDQYGLRRAALGIARLLRDAPAVGSLSIRDGLELAAARLREQSIEVSDDAVADACAFATARFAQLLRDEGVSAELVEVVEPALLTPRAVARTLDEVRAATEDDTFRALAAAIVRASRIVPAGTAPAFDAAHLNEPAEVQLREVVDSLPLTSATVEEYAAHASRLSPAINAFFEDILVMAEDDAVRAARLGLLASVCEKAPAVVDWQALDRYVN